ncbi:MAG: hypothetical protein Kow0010_16550 [Dehalococcoidia bacterium]
MIASRVLAVIAVVAVATATGSQTLTATIAGLPPAYARSCPTISGFVYHDINDNGLYDPGEQPIPGSPIELRTGSGTVVGSTVTSADGSYEFFFDATANAPVISMAHSVTFPVATTDWTLTQSLPRFDPETGVLVAVDIQNDAEITSTIEAESLDSAPATLTGTVSGEIDVLVGGSHRVLAVPMVDAGQFDAASYDGEPDFAGPSGHNFGSHTATETATLRVDGDALSAFVGPGSVQLEATARATSRTEGGGNVLNRIATTAGARAQLTYHYRPHTCLANGAYTIVQVEQPSGYADGRETAGNVNPLPNTKGSDAITVTLQGVDLPNNNFGELTGSLSGFVYVDLDDDGIKDAGEPPIPGVTITLTGKDARGNSVTAETATKSDGSYLFPGLVAGAYEITESQPVAYLDGKDTIGSQGGQTADDRFFDVVLAAGEHGIDNNFGELLPPAPTPTPTNPPGTPTVPATTTEPAGPEGSATPIDRVEGEKTPGAPGAGSGLALGVAGSPVNLLLAVAFLLCVGGGIALMVIDQRQRDEEQVP